MTTLHGSCRRSPSKHCELCSTMPEIVHLHASMAVPPSSSQFHHLPSSRWIFAPAPFTNLHHLHHLHRAVHHGSALGTCSNATDTNLLYHRVAITTNLQLTGSTTPSWATSQQCLQQPSRSQISTCNSPENAKPQTSTNKRQCVERAAASRPTATTASSCSNGEQSPRICTELDHCTVSHGNVTAVTRSLPSFCDGNPNSDMR